jgi:RNase P subunit RPR2
MAKKSKLSTPDWIKEGYDSKEEYMKVKGKNKSSDKKSGEKTFKIKICPKCKSGDVHVVLTGEEGKKVKEWECNKCKWIGTNIQEKELTEEEFMKYLDDKGEEVA